MENLLLSLGRRLPDDPGPGNVVEDGVRLIQLGPHIQQDEIAFADGSALFCAGSVVRIAAVLIHADNGGIVRHQMLAFEALDDPLLNLEFTGAAVASAGT